MAASRWKSTIVSSELFVEACGALAFDLTSKPKKVCLVRYGNDWLLPKGRRNCHESRRDAALREVEEETGYLCRLRPMTMATRAPSDLEPADVADFARTYDGLEEPFLLDYRDLGEGKGVKLVWWFIAEVEARTGPGEEHFKPHFFELDKAVERLTYQNDRIILRKAIDLLQQQGAVKTKRLEAAAA